MTIYIRCEEEELHAPDLPPIEFASDDAALEAGWWHDPGYREDDPEDDYWLCPTHAPPPDPGPPPTPFVQTEEFTAWYTPEKQAQVDAIGDHMTRYGGKPGPTLGGMPRLQGCGWHAVAVRALWILDHPEDFPPDPPRPSELVMAELHRRGQLSRG